MKRLVVVVFLGLFSSCFRDEDKHAHRVTPEIVEVGTDYCIVKWSNVGSQYKYGVQVRDGAQNDSSSGGTIIKFYGSIMDTIFTLDSLESNIYYKIIIDTFGENIAPNESWPPLRFKTL
jgi:hypothetical protein